MKVQLDKIEEILALRGLAKSGLIKPKDYNISLPEVNWEAMSKEELVSVAKYYDGVETHYIKTQGKFIKKIILLEEKVLFYPILAFVIGLAAAFLISAFFKKSDNIGMEAKITSPSTEIIGGTDNHTDPFQTTHGQKLVGISTLTFQNLKDNTLFIHGHRPDLPTYIADGNALIIPISGDFDTEFTPRSGKSGNPCGNDNKPIL